MTVNEIDERLSRDARRWQATRPAGPGLDDCLRALSGTGAQPGRRWRLAAVAAAAVMVLLVVAVAVALRSRAEHPSGPTGSRSSLRTCGKVPVPKGAVSRQAVLTISAPLQGRAGTSVEVTATVRAVGRAADGVDVGAPADVVIVKNGAVVGRYLGGIGGTGFLIASAAKPVPALAALLSGCPSGTIDISRPDASRRPLPPGRYQLVATLDPDGGDSFRIVSNVWPITIIK
jgi:hypothetical protein